MLGSDLGGPEAARIRAREEQGPASALVITLEHTSILDASLTRRLFDAIDDEHVDGTAARIEL